MRILIYILLLSPLVSFGQYTQSIPIAKIFNEKSTECLDSNFQPTTTDQLLTINTTTNIISLTLNGYCTFSTYDLRNHYIADINYSGVLPDMVLGNLLNDNNGTYSPSSYQLLIKNKKLYLYSETNENILPPFIPSYVISSSLVSYTPISNSVPFGLFENNYIRETVYKTAVPLTEDDILLSSAAGNNVPDSQKTVSLTYCDGLGNAKQQIARQRSGSGKDMLTHIEYDDYGRRALDFLPYASNQTNGNYVDGATLKGDVISQYQSLYTSDNPFSEKLMEASPLGRVLEQAAPGNDWSLSNADKHTVKLGYLTNTTNEVKLYKAISDGTSYESNGYYATTLTQTSNYVANQLYKTITKDENCTAATPNGGITEEFTDKEGHIVLKRTYGESIVDGDATYAIHDTYYVYDQYGNLSYVIPPLADSPNPMEQLDGLCYQYRYDYRNRLVEKKLPGKRWEYIVYDKLDRVAATSRIASPFTDISGTGWVITKYDTFGRPAVTGWRTAKVTSIERKALQDGYMLPSSIVNEARTATDTQMNAVAYRYSNVAYPTSDFEVLTVNYYDDYAFPGAPALPTSVEGQQVLTNTKDLVTGTWTRVLESTSEGRAQSSFIFYDTKSRPIRNLTNNYLGGYTQVDSKLDFTGKALYTITTHKRTSADTELKVQDNYWYTEEDRLLLHFQDINGSQHQLIARNEYDELGRLASKHVGGDNISPNAGGLQKVDYTYNIRGWLTGINNTDDLADSPADLFAFRIGYNIVTGDAPGIVPLYNGNIAETLWRSASDNILRKYGYRYDDMSRLRDAIYQKPDINTQAGSYQMGSYNESISYDKNGNITSLSRNGDLDAPDDFIEIDKLSYEYSHQYPNRLMKVTDASNDSSGFKDDDGSEGTDDYSYDPNGNMTQDANKGIQTISYNHLGLPTGIVFEGTASRKIDYLYDASGQKLAKTVTIVSEAFVDDYLDGFQYSNGSLSFFPTAEGYVRNTVVDGQNHFNYVFNFTDHLGNIRMSYGIDPKDDVLKIMEENHYYPFGLKHARYNTVKKAFGKESNSNNIVMRQVIDPGDDNPLDVAHFGSYQYKFSGKEYQDDLRLNLYDYGARNYDPAIGKWMSIDPKAELLERSSPYVYALNSPLVYVDNDGELPILINGKTMNDSERADISYWTLSIVNTIKNSGIANPGGEVHYVDGNRGHDWSDKIGGYATKGDNVNSPSRRAQGGRYAAVEDWESILSKLARDPKTGKIIEKIQIYTHSRGAAFGVGYTEKLLELIKQNSSQFADPDNVIDFVYNMAPHQSDFLTAPDGVDSYSMDHYRDKLSDNDMNGVKGAFSSGEKSKGFFGAHSISSFQNDLKAFTSSFLKGGTSQDIINNFVKTMKDKYGITITVK